MNNMVHIDWRMKGLLNDTNYDDNYNITKRIAVSRNNNQRSK